MRWIYISLISAFLFSCKKSNTPPNNSLPCDPAISYLNKVKPVFVSSCSSSGCHDGINSSSLTEYTVARDAAQQIRTAVDRGIMPKGSILSAADKAAIICWIDSGTKNN
jgi:hypothetical protein